MTEPGVVRIGIVGCGGVTAGIHLPVLRHVRGAEVVALADTDPKTLDAVGSRFGVKARFSDHIALLERPDVDAVAVCVPPELHERVTLDALRAGKHVLLEKPPALTVESCDRLIEQTKQSGRQTMVGFHLRHHRLIRRARAMLREGRLGAIEAARSTWTSAARCRGALPSWRDRRELGGGVFFDTAIHHFDLWRFLLDDDIAEVHATSRSRAASDETAAITATTARGTVIGAVFSEWTGDGNSVEVFGRDASVRLSLYRFDGFELRPATVATGKLRSIADRLARKAAELPAAVGSLRMGGSYLASHHALWCDFLEAIRTGTPFGADLEDGKRAVAAVLAAIESATTGEPVRPATDGARREDDETSV